MISSVRNLMASVGMLQEICTVCRKLQLSAPPFLKYDGANYWGELRA